MSDELPDRRMTCPRMPCQSLSAWTGGHWLTPVSGHQIRAYDYQCDEHSDHQGLVLEANNGDLTLK